MNYKLVRSKRKTLVITITGGEVIVKAPNGMSLEHIENFVKQKSDWIEKKLAELERKTSALSPVIDGEATLYHGDLLELVPCGAAKAHIDGGALYMPQKYDTKQKRDRAIASLFKRFAEKELADLLYRTAARLGLEYGSFALTNARTKWGSCDGKCNIRLNWRLIMLDDELASYVVIHELAHTLFHDHSAAFWAQVGRFMPDYKSARKRLKSFSVLTTLYR